jgi:molybdenum cofactor cytidylyltransferase
VIGAVVLAAGLSQRMGRPKMILPWGDTTVIGRVVSVLLTEVDEVVVVTGGAKNEVEVALEKLPVRTVFNPDFANGEMLLSLKVGLASFPDDIEATLIALGDQPQIEESVVQQVISGYKQTKSSVVVPSYQMRRGHPWLLAHPLWDTVFDLQPPNTLRDFLRNHAAQINYIEVENPSIIQDLDTPDDYHCFRPA